MPSRTRPRGRQAWANATHHVKLARENVTNQLASFGIHLLLFAKHQCLADVLASNRLRLGWQPFVVGVNAAVDEFVQARFWNRFWPLEGMGRLKEANNEKPRPVLRQSMVFAVEDLVARLVSQSFEAADDVVEGRFVKSQQTHYIFKQNYPRKMMSNVRQTVVHDFATDLVLSAQLEASMAEALTRKATMVHINRLHLCQISISDVVIERLGRKVVKNCGFGSLVCVTREPVVNSDAHALQGEDDGFPATAVCPNGQLSACSGRRRALGLGKASRTGRSAT